MLVVMLIVIKKMNITMTNVTVIVIQDIPLRTDGMVVTYITLMMNVLMIVLLKMILSSLLVKIISIIVVVLKVMTIISLVMET